MTGNVGKQFSYGKSQNFYLSYKKGKIFATYGLVYVVGLLGSKRPTGLVALMILDCVLLNKRITFIFTRGKGC